MRYHTCDRRSSSLSCACPLLAIGAVAPAAMRVKRGVCGAVKKLEPVTACASFSRTEPHEYRVFDAQLFPVRNSLLATCTQTSGPTSSADYSLFDELRALHEDWCVSAVCAPRRVQARLPASSPEVQVPCYSIRSGARADEAGKCLPE